MTEWLKANAGTLVVSLALLGIVAAIVRKMVCDRKAGKSSCGCGCSHCAMRGACHAGKSTGTKEQ
ncbi:MAG: FeoB-associated Cys-rich membrane protein [Clostridia bacterium]|nr:FeoB-associated Cys-rich membrane protein [Clostridia bacterium]